MLRGRINRFLLIIFLFAIISLIPAEVFAKGGRGGGIGSGIVSFGSSGFQINDPVMFCLYLAFFMVIGIGLAYSYLRVYRVKQKVKALEEREQRLYESGNLKDIEKHKSYGNESNNGYLVCEECNGYYMLESNEYPQDFDTCHCGGNLIYYNDVDEFC